MNASMAAYAEIDWPAAKDGIGMETAFGEPAELLVARRPDEVADLLRRVEGLAEEGFWLLGFVAYKAASAFDAALACRPEPEGLPLAMFAVFRSRSAPRERHDFLCGPWQSMLPRHAFDVGVASIHRDIAAGRCYQVNYTAKLRAAFLGDGAALFDALRRSQPGAYSAYLDFGRWQVCSVSPELFFHWQPADGGGRRLTTRPMKGTAPRHGDIKLDQEAADGLRESAKERAENLMIVDLLRNDLSRVAQLGSVSVPNLFSVEPWATVWQMTSTVECRARPGTGLADVFAALFPCGSVTGAPKIEAMRAITELEPAGRGVYCGAVGVVMPGGEARFNVGIRTVVIDREAGRAECGIGSGIVLDSTADGEYAEWQAKQRFLRQTCPDYRLFETLLWRRGRYWLRRHHLARLAASAAVLGFPLATGAVDQALDTATERFGTGQWWVRLQLAADGDIAVAAEPMVPTPGPISVALADRAVDSANPLLRHKTTQRQLYESLARPDVFDTLLWNERGEVTEFTRGNLVVHLDDGLWTPALDCGLLPGTFRAALLARGVVREAVITFSQLDSARALWFVNSVRGAHRVEKVLGGRPSTPGRSYTATAGTGAART